MNMSKFENFQLYRTNVLLGGNMKYDLIINDMGEELYVEDFHITPICGRDPLKLDLSENMLDKSHQENVKSFYNKCKSTFYKEVLSTNIQGDWPILYNDKNTTKSYNDNYFMGCRRAIEYSRYNRQFEFLVPMWLENFEDDLVFVIEVRGFKNNNLIASKALVIQNPLKESNKEYPQFHQDFCKYFYNYMKDVGLAGYKKEVKDYQGQTETKYVPGGSNEVYNVSFADDVAYVHGLNIDTSSIDSKLLLFLTHELTSKETPICDFNQRITNAFRDNGYIAKQLFNFNICFNIKDIISSSLDSQIKWSDLNVSVKVKYGNDVLDVKDFLTNYDYIQPKTTTHITDLESQAPKSEYNVLDYLKEYKALPYANFNKLTQSTPYWSLVGNNDYIFNLYDGFGGVSIDGSESIKLSHVYGGAFNQTATKHSIQNNNENWCSVIDVNSRDLGIVGFEKLMIYPKLYRHLFTKRGHWMNDMYYDYDDNQDFNFDYITIIKYNDPNYQDMYNIESRYKFKKIWESMYCKIVDKVLFLVNSKDKDDKGNTPKDDNEDIIFSKILSNITNKLKNLDDPGDLQGIELEGLKGLELIMKSLTPPKTINFPAGVVYDLASGPSSNVREIDYYENDDCKSYVCRYDGPIKPTFIDSNSTQFNNMYFKTLIDIDDMGVYSKYSTTGFSPLYNSINYYHLNKIKMDYKYITDNLTNFDKEPAAIQNDIQNAYSKLGYKYEYTWFNHNRILYLPVTLSDTFETNDVYSNYHLLFLDFLKKYVKDNKLSSDDNDIEKLNIEYNINNEHTSIMVSVRLYNVYQMYNCKLELIDSSNDGHKKYKIELELK